VDGVQYVRGLLITLAASVILTGCGKAAASEPDSGNPAHCAAALNMAAAWNEKDKSSPHPEWTAQYRAGMLYEIEKIKKGGRSVEGAKAESLAFTRAYYKDPRMPSFVLECVRAEAQDSNFRAELPRLMEAASQSSGRTAR
jgi:hypothetical protein